MNTPGNAAQRSIPSLDGWRAFAVLLVVIAHVAPVRHAWDDGVGIRARWIEHPVEFGALGVRVFFVLSGYLITRLLLTERDRTGTVSLGRFYVRRLFRIAPALLVYLAVIGVLGAAGVVPMIWRNYVMSLAYVSNYVTGNWLTWHTWSLSVEEQFYALWPAALLLVARRAWRTPVAVIALVPLLRLLEYRYYSGTSGMWLVGAHFETVADGLATGVCLAFAARRLSASPAYARWLNSFGPWLLGPAVLLALATRDTLPTFYLLLGLPAANIGVALLVDWTVRRPASLLGRVLNVAPLRWVGRLSYSIYLWQQLTVANAPGRVPLPASHWLTPLTTIPGVFVTTLAIAAISYYGVEQPALRLRAWFESRFGARPPAPVLAKAEA